MLGGGCSVIRVVVVLCCGSNGGYRVVGSGSGYRMVVSGCDGAACEY